MCVCLIRDSSIVATCPSISAARFAFCFCLRFIRFDLVVHNCVSGEPKQNQGRRFVDRKLAQAIVRLAGDYLYGKKIYMYKCENVCYYTN